MDTTKARDINKPLPIVDIHGYFNPLKAKDFMALILGDIKMPPAIITCHFLLGIINLHSANPRVAENC